MLSRIAEDKHHVVTPVIENIQEDNFKIQMSKHKDIQVGHFKWDMTFSWMLVPTYIRKNLTSKAMPIRFVVG